MGPDATGTDRKRLFPSIAINRPASRRTGERPAHGRPGPLAPAPGPQGIQPNVTKDIARVITYLARDRGMAVVLVEQYFEFARDLGDTLAIMVRGEMALATPTRSLNEDEVRKHLTV